MDGAPHMRGLEMPEKRLKATTLPIDKNLQAPPISMYLSEDWKEADKGNFFERKLDMTKTIANNDFTLNIKEAHQHTLIYKPMKNVFE